MSSEEFKKEEDMNRCGRDSGARIRDGNREEEPGEERPMATEFVLSTTRRFERSFRKIDRKTRSRLLERIEELRVNPYIGYKMMTRPLWYIRVGNYRVFYRIDEENKQVILVDVVHRRAAYR